MNKKKQKHQPNPTVNRAARKEILEKRIRNISKRVYLTGTLAKKLAQYKTELKELEVRQ